MGVFLFAVLKKLDIREVISKYFSFWKFSAKWLGASAIRSRNIHTSLPEHEVTLSGIYPHLKTWIWAVQLKQHGMINRAWIPLKTNFFLMLRLGQSLAVLGHKEWTVSQEELIQICSQHGLKKGEWHCSIEKETPLISGSMPRFNRLIIPLFPSSQSSTQTKKAY